MCIWLEDFFEDENRTATVTSARYVVMLETYLQHRLEETAEDQDLRDVWFQQDDELQRIQLEFHLKT